MVMMMVGMALEKDVYLVAGNMLPMLSAHTRTRNIPRTTGFP